MGIGIIDPIDAMQRGQVRVQGLEQMSRFGQLFPPPLDRAGRSIRRGWLLAISSFWFPSSAAHGRRPRTGWAGARPGSETTYHLTERGHARTLGTTASVRQNLMVLDQQSGSIQLL
jgi:hypothetical protein